MKINLVRNLLLLSTFVSSQVAFANFYIANDQPAASRTISGASSASVVKHSNAKTAPTPMKTSTSRTKTVSAPIKAKADPTKTIPVKVPSANTADPILSSVKHSTVGHSSKSESQGYTLRSGSLRHNIESIVHQSHWGEVVWSLPYDYRWVGTAHFKEKSVQAVLSKLLASYPVQAIFYEQNHVVQIVPRPVVAYHRPADPNHRSASLKQQESSRDA